VEGDAWDCCHVYRISPVGEKSITGDFESDPTSNSPASFIKLPRDIAIYLERLIGVC